MVTHPTEQKYSEGEKEALGYVWACERWYMYLYMYHRARNDLSSWNDDCVARWLCTVIPSGLQGRILAMAYEGHLAVIRVKQHVKVMVWWPGIDRDNGEGLCSLPHQRQDRSGTDATIAVYYVANCSMVPHPGGHL